MKPSHIGLRTKCAKPKALHYRASMRPVGGSATRDATHIPLARKTLDERERHDATTASTHSTPSNR